MQENSGKKRMERKSRERERERGREEDRRTSWTREWAREALGNGWKGRSVKWPGISQALRTQDRDVLKGAGQKAIVETARWVEFRPLSPPTFFSDRRCRWGLRWWASRQHAWTENGFLVVARNCSQRVLETTVDYSALVDRFVKYQPDPEPMVLLRLFSAYKVPL